MHVNNRDPAKRRPWREAYRKMPYLYISEAGWKPRFSSVTPATANDPAVVEAFAKASVQVEVKTPTGPQLDIVTLMPMPNPRLMSDHGPLAIQETSSTLCASAPCLSPHDRLSLCRQDEYT